MWRLLLRWAGIALLPPEFVLSVPRAEQSVLTKHQAAEALGHLWVSDARWFSCNLLSWLVPGARVCSGEVTLTVPHLSIHGFPLLSHLFHTMVSVRLYSSRCCRHLRYVAVFWRKLFIRIVSQKQKLGSTYLNTAGTTLITFFEELRIQHLRDAQHIWKTSVLDS